MKKLLFVSDKPISSEYYRDNLNHNEFDIELAHSLNDFIEVIIEHKFKFDCVIIDLHFRMDMDFPQELKRHYLNLRPFILNEGQMLGMYLKENSTTPFLYLSCYPIKYNPSKGYQDDICISNDVEFKIFLEKLNLKLNV